MRDRFEEPPRSEDAKRDAAPMLIFAGTLVFLIAVGAYMSGQRDREGNAVQTQSKPVTTESGVAGARSPSYQESGQSGVETTGQR